MASHLRKSDLYCCLIIMPLFHTHAELDVLINNATSSVIKVEDYETSGAYSEKPATIANGGANGRIHVSLAPAIYKIT